MKIEDLASIAVLFLLIGVVLGVGADVLTGVQENVQKTSTLTGGRDQWIGTNGSAFVLTTRSDTGLVFSAMTVKNDSGGETLIATNYTFNANNGSIILTTAGNASYGGATLNLTYSYALYTGVAHDSVKNATAGMGELASWLPTIALILAAAVLIGLLVVYFRTRRD